MGPLLSFPCDITSLVWTVNREKGRACTEWEASASEIWAESVLDTRSCSLRAER